ncbi:unnamed protein product, partial [Trichogramma brassicae]
ALRAKRSVEQQYEEAHSRINELTTINVNIASSRAKLEQELSTLAGDYEEVTKELRVSDERYQRVQNELKHTVEILHEEQERIVKIETIKKSLEIEVKNLSVRLEEVEANAIVGGKRIISKLEARIRDLELELDEEKRRHAETVKILRKKERNIKEVMIQVEEDSKNIALLQESLDKTTQKVNIYKRQLQEQEGVSQQSVTRVRRFQRELEAAEDRADTAESNLSLIRAKHRSFVTTSTVPGSQVYLVQETTTSTQQLIKIVIRNSLFDEIIHQSYHLCYGPVSFTLHECICPRSSSAGRWLADRAQMSLSCTVCRVQGHPESDHRGDAQSRLRESAEALYTRRMDVQRVQCSQPGTPVNQLQCEPRKDERDLHRESSTRLIFILFFEHYYALETLICIEKRAKKALKTEYSLRSLHVTHARQTQTSKHQDGTEKKSKKTASQKYNFTKKVGEINVESVARSIPMNSFNVSTKSTISCRVGKKVKFGKSLSPEQLKRVTYIEQKIKSFEVQLNRLELYLKTIDVDPVNAKIRSDILGTLYKDLLKYIDELTTLQSDNSHLIAFANVDVRYFAAASAVVKLQKVEELHGFCDACRHAVTDTEHIFASRMESGVFGRTNRPTNWDRMIMAQ